MSRPRKRENQGLPQNLLSRKRKRSDGTIIEYFFYAMADGSEKSLGKDKHLAIMEAAKLNYVSLKSKDKILFIEVSARYEEEIIPTKKAKNTRNSNKQALKHLNKFFGNPPVALEDIQPKHIVQYLEWRKNTPAVANIEIGLFSHIWNTARMWGYTKDISPSTGVKKFKINYRDIYVEDFVLEKIYACADQDLKDIMDTAYILGQRPIDVVKIHSNHIYDGILHITQQKTGKKVRIELIGRLKDIIEKRITKNNQYLFTNSWGNKLERPVLTRKFRELRELACETYPELAEEISKVQIRDLRAKAATDLSLSINDDAARKQLGHKSQSTTQIYIRKDPVLKPVK